MEQDILNAVFEEERTIREIIAAEQRKADERLARVSSECAILAEREEARLQEELTAAVAAAGAGEARRRAETILADSEARSKRLAGLGDDQLKGFLLQEIITILPGE